MKKINNVDLKKIEEVITKWRDDNNVLVKNMSIKGEWNLKEGPDFRVKLKFEKGETELIIDSPSFMGGEGLAPSPLQICLAGLISCFAGTIAGIAAEKNIELEKLEVGAETSYDLSKTFGLTNNPVNKGVKFIVDIKAKRSEEEIEAILKEAEERCPAIFCLKNPIPVEVARISE